MIIKFQKDLLRGDTVLIYDKRKTILQEIPNFPELNKLFKGRLKMYRNCTIDKNGILNIKEEAKGF